MLELVEWDAVLSDTFGGEVVHEPVTEIEYDCVPENGSGYRGKCLGRLQYV